MTDEKRSEALSVQDKYECIDELVAPTGSNNIDKMERRAVKEPSRKERKRSARYVV